ncbi:type I restriction enzyme, S subunit [Treponema bryantii]|uniref:Type I restriction enzyme, S subunit n=1 Tax=Treponema bryantii TaxID=163 RepID=A0A1H9B813_9SPIR|nr:restriction endonuclease subunit S [Treponema bryantii]SEP84999.1 type I restriction enzyme, S subunit [Treponema bryantii]
MEFKSYRLGELCQRLSSGKSITAENIKEEGKYPVYGANGLRGYTDSYNFDGSCAVIGRQGAYCGNVKYVSGQVYMSEHAVVAQANKYNNSKYLAYKLGILQLGRFSGQAAQPGLSVQRLSRLLMEMPEKDFQDKVSTILSRYDEAIENNNKRIKLLEEMAQNLYKEWFVRFRFPGWKNEQYKDSCIGKIPKTFSVLKQSEVISDYIGGGWGNDDESANYPIQAAVVRGADFPEFTKGNVSTCPVRFHKKSNYESRIISEDDIVLEVSGGTQEQPVGRTVIVTKERLERFDNKLICASFCKLIRLNKQIIAPFFYYYWMQFVYDTRIIDRYQLQSTGIINFKFEYFLRKGDVLLPPSELMWEFDSKVRTIHKQIENLAKANENLAKQRDLLLPRLMSGKLEVK